MLTIYALATLFCISIGYIQNKTSEKAYEQSPQVWAERHRSLNSSLIQLRRRADVIDEILTIRQKNLQLQMNPHFIFNALTGIHMLLLRGESGPALKALRRFKGLLVRSWGDSSNNLRSLRASTIAKEINFLQDYVALEKLRLSTNVIFKIIKPNNIADSYPLPAFLIQPLIENSLWHGIDASLQDLSITPEIRLEFSILKSSDMMQISVYDNGKGIPEIKDNNNEGERPSQGKIKQKAHGLNILRERLKIISSRSSLTIENRSDTQGCIATIKVPYINFND